MIQSELGLSEEKKEKELVEGSFRSGTSIISPIVILNDFFCLKNGIKYWHNTTEICLGVKWIEWFISDFTVVACECKEEEEEDDVAGEEGKRGWIQEDWNSKGKLS